MIPNQKVGCSQLSPIHLRLILIVLTIAVFGISLRNGFVWDESLFLVNNPEYRNFNLRAILFSLAGVTEYYPITAFTFALDFKIWGSNPFGFHLTNLLLLTGNVLLVHYLADIIIKKCSALSGKASTWFAPFAVAVGFAIHPINSEPASWIGARNVLVSGLFFFLSTICIIKYLEKSDSVSLKLYLAAILAFVCAMLGKATVIVLPVLLLSILPLLFPHRQKKIAILLAPFFAVALGFFLFLKKIADSVGYLEVNSLSSMSGKLIRALQIPGFYLKRLFIPHGFSVEYATGFAEHLFAIRTIMASVVIVVLLVTAVLTRRHLTGITLGICWFLVALIPVLNFFSTHPVVADRYAYLPSFGIMLIMGILLDSLTQVRMKLLLFTPIICLLAFLSVKRSLEWKSDETLWSANIRNFPNDSKSYINLAAFYVASQQQQKALNLLTSNISIPGLSIYRDYLEGEFLLEQNDLAGAKIRLQKVIDVSNGFVSALYALGRIAEKEGDYVSAGQYYNRALFSGNNDLFTNRPAIMENLESLRSARLDPLLSGLKQRVEKNPADFEAHKELAITLDSLGDYKEALTHYLVLERGGVKGWQILHNIANCYFNMHNNADAVGYYERAVTLGSVSEETFNNLGIAYRNMSNYKSSIEVLQSAVKKFPNAPYPLFSLGVTYSEAGENEKARSVFMEIGNKFPEYKDKAAPYLLKLSGASK